MGRKFAVDLMRFQLAPPLQSRQGQDTTLRDCREALMRSARVAKA
jgi:hypothetical protein